MSTDTKCVDFAKQIKDLREYGPFARELGRDEVANAFEALLEIVAGRESPTASLAPEWATLATHLESAAGQPIGDLTPKYIGHVAKEAAYRADNLAREVTDLRRQKTDLETALASTMTAWHKDKAALEAKLATLKQSSDRYHDQAHDLRAELAATTKRADLAEATLESVRAAVAKPAEDKQDGRPKIGDAVPWAEVEAWALYYRPDLPYAFRGVTANLQSLLDGPHDEDLPRLLRGGGNPLSELQSGYLSSPTGILVARDLGTDPEVWRTTMREHLAKAGK